MTTTYVPRVSFHICYQHSPNFKCNCPSYHAWFTSSVETHSRVFWLPFSMEGKPDPSRPNHSLSPIHLHHNSGGQQCASCPHRYNKNHRYHREKFWWVFWSLHLLSSHKKITISHLKVKTRLGRNTGGKKSGHYLLLGQKSIGNLASIIQYLNTYLLLLVIKIGKENSETPRKIIHNT